MLVPPTSPRSEQVGLNYWSLDSVVIFCFLGKMRVLAKTAAIIAPTPTPTLMAIYLFMREMKKI